MATVTVPSIKTGDEITSTTLNTFIDSVNALSGNVSADNMDAEAVDRRNLRLNIPRIAHNQTNSDVTFSGQSNIVSELGPITHVVGEKIHVCASFQFFERTGAQQIATPNVSHNRQSMSRFEFRLRRREASSTSWVQIGSSARLASAALNICYLPMSRSITLEFMDTISQAGDFHYALFGETIAARYAVGAFDPTCVVDSHCFFVVRYPE